MAKNLAFEQLLEEIKDLHERKNDNYARAGDPLSNLKVCERFACPTCGTKIPAWLGVAIRLSDKWERFANLIGGSTDRVGEDVKETVRDQAIYSLLWILLRKEWEDQQNVSREEQRT